MLYMTSLELARIFEPFSEGRRVRTLTCALYYLLNKASPPAFFPALRRQRIDLLFGQRWGQKSASYLMRSTCRYRGLPRHARL
jgi:hypothetical protein